MSVKVENPIHAAREVLERKQARKVEGVLLDIVSANLIVTVFDHPHWKPEQKRKLETVPIVRLVDFCWKCVK